MTRTDLNGDKEKKQATPEAISQARKALNQHLPRFDSCTMLQKHIVFGEYALGDLQSMENHKNMGRIYQRLRECDGMVAKYFEGNKESYAYFMNNMTCVGNATCPVSFQRWSKCMKNQYQLTKHGGQQLDLTVCDLYKRQVERCVQGVVNDLVEASQKELFTP